jgi:hypothetical protein
VPSKEELDELGECVVEELIEEDLPDTELVGLDPADPMDVHGLLRTRFDSIGLDKSRFLAFDWRLVDLLVVGFEWICAVVVTDVVVALLLLLAIVVEIVAVDDDNDDVVVVVLLDKCCLLFELDLPDLDLCGSCTDLVSFLESFGDILLPDKSEMNFHWIVSARFSLIGIMPTDRTLSVTRVADLINEITSSWIACSMLNPFTRKIWSPGYEEREEIKSI